MIDEGLKGKKEDWLAAVNTTYRIPNGLSAFTDLEFRVNSAYRNPYHQRFHVGAPYGVASFHSRHPFGDALDVHTPDVNGNGTTEQVVGNETNSADGVLMELTARDRSVGAQWTASYRFYSTHTHADWTLRTQDGGDWPPPDGTIFHLPCDISGDSSSSGTDTACTTPTPTPDPEPQMAVCGIHDASASGDHTLTYVCNTPPCINRVVPMCLALCPETSSHGTTTILGVCGHIFTPLESYDHSWGTRAVWGCNTCKLSLSNRCH